MGNADTLIPIRRILVDGVYQQFIRDLDISSATGLVTVDQATGIATITLGGNLGIVIVGATRETPETGPVIFGARYFAGHAGVTFRALLQATSGMTCRVRLMNAAGDVLATLTSTSVAVPEMKEAVIDLPMAAAVYYVDCCISAGTPGVDDRAVCHSAVVEIG